MEPRRKAHYSQGKETSSEKEDQGRPLNKKLTNANSLYSKIDPKKSQYLLEQEGEREKTREADGVRTAEGIDVPNSVLAKVEA